MTRAFRSRRLLNWRAAALLGLVSSTFSTLVSQFTAARIGRDAAVDWMAVATIPLREGVLQADPTAPVIAAGILFHQWADFSWALVFFGLLGRWTAGLSPWTLLVLAAPWALFTSAMEWFVLVPLVPFGQPLFTLEQPYWIGFLVHAISASIYPLFPFLRDWLDSRLPSRNARFAAVWSSLAAMGVVLLGTLALFGSQNREWPWMGRDPDFDQGYMRRMAAHHAQGIAIARLAIDRAQAPHLRQIARLMVASQRSETAVFGQWWRSWFPGSLPPPTAEEHASMPGMVASEQMDALRDTEGPSFDPLFVRIMTAHHQGAIKMADEAIRQAGDPRLRIMAHATRHSQRGEIELMHRTSGLEAVKAATLSLITPAGEAQADRRGQPAASHGTHPPML